jgi:hypothetical protein
MPQSKRPDALRWSRFSPSKVVHFEPGYFDRKWYTLTDRRQYVHQRKLVLTDCLSLGPSPQPTFSN